MTECLILAIISGELLVERSAPERRTVRDASVCSIGGPPFTRDPRVTFVLGRAMRDTLFAGEGDIRTSDTGTGTHPVYGQVVRVDSLSGPGAGLTRRALAKRGSSLVVVVPWDYGAACEPFTWRGSARWTSPDSSGLYSAQLRPESLWVAGHPTFDALYATVHSYAHGPYTLGPRRRFPGRRRGAIPEGSLTPGEVFSLYSRLPTLAQRSDTTATQELREWVRRNPRAQSRWPGTNILPVWGLGPER